VLGERGWGESDNVLWVRLSVSSKPHMHPTNTHKTMHHTAELGLLVAELKVYIPV